MNSKMSELDYLREDLSSCTLCAWECGANRMDGEVGVCGITIPEVSSSQLHPAPPASFDAFLTGCSFRCLSCQNWPIANYPANDFYDTVEGYYEPREWAELALTAIDSNQGKRIGADRIFFTGGEPSCSLPWCEEVVSAARFIDHTTKVNFDTNGFMTAKSLKRIISFTTSITFDIKAYDPKLFNALTGADVEVVLKNAEYIAKNAPEKLWEFRILVIPSINEHDIGNIIEFIANLDPSLPVNFLAFRPNFVLENHSWATRSLMANCVKTAEKAGLDNVSWHGQTSDHPVISTNSGIPAEVYEYATRMHLPFNTALAIAYAHSKGCISTSLRVCGLCEAMNKCKLKRFTTVKLL